MIDDYDAPRLRFNKLELLDNNILSNKQWFFEVTDAILELEKRTKRRMRIDFNQGLDIRLIDSEIAERLSKMSYINAIKFAFDSMGVKDAVLRGIDILNAGGISVRNKCFFYVYVHDDDQFDDAYERCMILKEHNATPYIMLNQDAEHTRRLRNLKKWCRPWTFWTIDFKDYLSNYSKKMKKEIE